MREEPTQGTPEEDGIASTFPQVKGLIIRPSGPWHALSHEMENMEIVWRLASNAAVKKGILEQAEIDAFRAKKRKPAGVHARTFQCYVDGREIENGTWLCSYPLLTAADKTWRARLDVLYHFLDSKSCLADYIGNKILTVQEHCGGLDFADQTSYSFNFTTQDIELTTNIGTVDAEIAKQVFADTSQRRHRDIYPKMLAGQINDQAAELGASGRPVTRVLDKRRKRVVSESDEDEEVSARPSDGASSSRTASRVAGNAGEATAGPHRSEPADAELKKSRREKRLQEDNERLARENRQLKRENQRLRALVERKTAENLELEFKRVEASGEAEEVQQQDAQKDSELRAA